VRPVAVAELEPVAPERVPVVAEPLVAEPLVAEPLVAAVERVPVAVGPQVVELVVPVELVAVRVPVVVELQVVAVEQPVVVQAAVRLVPAEAAVPAVSVAPTRPHCRPHRVSPVATLEPRHLWVRWMPAPVSWAMAAVQGLVVERVAAQERAVARVQAAVVRMWANSSTRPVPAQAPRSTLRRAWERLSARRFRRQRPLVAVLRLVAVPRWVLALLSVAVPRLVVALRSVVARPSVAVPRLVVALRLVAVHP
jgi:hypothetical protein